MSNMRAGVAGKVVQISENLKGQFPCWSQHQSARGASGPIHELV